VLLLAIDTCDSRGSLALLKDGQVVQTEVHETSEDYSSWLLPAVQRLLDAAGTALPAVSAYAVANGPGSFTGVRIGLTTVKAWGELYGKPIAPVSRLEALSTYSSRRFPYVAVFIDAQRAQLFGALYRRQSAGLQRVEDEVVIAPEHFLDWVAATAEGSRVEWISPDPKIVAQTEKWSSRSALGETVQVVAPVFAPAIGRLGYQLAADHRTVDALSLDANYVRRSDAEIFWKGAPSHGR
jgi:tRNA threonylcarbamoyladenosine biosynthesis protein TsaB